MAITNKVSLATMGGGAVIERFNYELAKVMKNIGDINTKATEPRTVTLTVTIKPNESRDFTNVNVNVKSKLASIKSQDISFHLIEQDGELVALEYNPKQERLAFEEV